MHELRQMISERRKKLQRERNKESEKEHEGERGRAREKERHQREKELEKDRERVKNAKEREQQHTNQTDRAVVRDHEKVTAKHEENGAVGGNLLFIGNGVHYLLSHMFFVTCLVFCCIF